MPAKSRAQKTKTPPILARWSTGLNLQVTSAPRSRLQRELIDAGKLIDPSAHVRALRGATTEYEIRHQGRTYRVRVGPRVNLHGRIVGSKGTLRRAAPRERGLAGAILSPSPVLDLARTIAKTAKLRAEMRIRKLEEDGRKTEAALRTVRAEERRTRLLAESAAILESPVPPEPPLERIGHLLTRTYADGFVLYLADDGRKRRRVLVAKEQPMQEALERAFPETLENGALFLVRPSLSELIPATTPADEARIIGDAERRRALKQAGVQSLLRTALRTARTSLGDLYLLRTDPAHPFDLADLRMAEALAARIGLREESLRLHEEMEREIARRKEAEARLLDFNAELERLVKERTRLLEESMREANDFAYTVAHDLRSPLRAMTGFCQALRDDYRATIDDIGRDYLERIVAGARRMDDLIRDLLAYSRLSREDLKLETVDLDAVLRSTLEQMTEELKQKGARIHQSPLGRVVGQGPILGQVLTNLVTNAVKFTQPGVPPEVTIRSEESPGRRRIFVEDNGIGISPQYHERIFGIFERLNRVEQYPGTGIGLAIVRRALERLGGKVGVDSELGSGSRFWFELPLP